MEAPPTIQEETPVAAPAAVEAMAVVADTPITEPLPSTPAPVDSAKADGPSAPNPNAQPEVKENGATETSMDPTGFRLKERIEACVCVCVSYLQAPEGN